MKYELRIKKNFLHLLCALFFVGLILPAKGRAAEMFFSVPDPKPAVGELFKADFLINTEGENINAMAGNIIFSGDSLELKEIRDGNSIINFWVDRPALKDGKIIFSGISPGGYKGVNGALFSLIFRVLKSGSVSIQVAQGQALLNDGKGTEAKLSAPALSFQAGAKSDGAQENYDLNDKTPPGSFVPEIGQDKNIADGRRFVVFAAQDKESGIDHYEVQENKSDKANGEWKIAVSPYVLQDQSLRSYVYIKAVDKAGNSTIATVNPKQPPLSFKTMFIYGIILVLGIFFGMRLWRKRGG